MALIDSNEVQAGYLIAEEYFRKNGLGMPARRLIIDILAAAKEARRKRIKELKVEDSDAQE